MFNNLPELKSNKDPTTNENMFIQQLNAIVWSEIVKFGMFKYRGPSTYDVDPFLDAM